jgi:hypothetical protein
MGHAFAAAAALMVATVGLAGEPRLDFNRDVRPLLSDRCFACHGPDEEDRQAGLRLDTRETAIAPLESGSVAIVPEEAAASELVARITSDDPTLVMPPPEVGKPLSEAEAAVLRQWIDEGAEYEDHWAFQRLERPEPPPVRDAAWPQTPIDRFILARLEAEDFPPNPEADRVTLARRLALDLTGLPPQPEMVDRFLADRSPHAYEAYVDTLLASPHYGERMAIEWLDAARYADSHGYQTDSSRSNWPWRDWLIRALNDNLPFDEFTIDQVAGDMLKAPTRDQMVATGFNRNHRINGEGGIIAEEWRVETVIDRVETTCQTWLGLTAGCARCHDHKYDPLSQREFYALYAVFNNVPETGTIMGPQNRAGGNSDPLFELPSPDQQLELARLTQVVADAEVAVAAELKGIDQLIARWERSLGPALDRAMTVWTPFEPLEFSSASGAGFRRIEDGSWQVEGAEPPRDTYEFEALLPGQVFGGLRLEVLPDVTLAGGGFGRTGNGNIVVSRVEVEIEPAEGGEPIPVKLTRAEADYSQKNWPAAAVLAGRGGRGWAIDGHDPAKREPRRLAVFPATATVVSENSRIIVRIRQEALDHHSIGRFRLAITAADPALLGVDGLDLPAEVETALSLAPEQRSAEQRTAVRKFYRSRVDGPIRRAETARDAAKKSLADFRNSLPSAMVMQEGPVRDAFILVRGEYDKPGEQVTAGLPAFLPPLPDGAEADRLSLARWLVSRDNPLTARVQVNRLWERFFGTGLVKTSENLGSQAEYPSHPELLDWLAVEFIEGDSLPSVAGRPAGPWNMKALVKLLVTSAVYRQSAAIRPDHLARDPENRLLARASRIRLPAEMVRDQALAVAGLLVPVIGGPSVRPWMPDGVWDDTSRYGDLRGYKPDTGPGRHRRSMYTIWKRTAAPPTMLLFDAPNRETCQVRRSRTNTPLQALALLNEPTFVEAAQALAARMLAEGGDAVTDRLRHGFRLAIGRSPSPAELAMLVAGFEADQTAFAADVAAAKQLVDTGLALKPEGVPPPDFAAYMLAANVLINLDEFVMRE